MTPPSTHTDSCGLEANTGGIIVNLMEASTACFPSMWARYCSSHKLAALLSPHLLAELSGSYRGMAAWGHQRDTSHQGSIGEKSHHFCHCSCVVAQDSWDLSEVPTEGFYSQCGQISPFMQGECQQPGTLVISFHQLQWSRANLVWTLNSLHSARPQPGLATGETSSPSLCWRKKGPKAGLPDCARTSAIISR